MHKAYRFRIYPSSEQETMIRKTFGCVRFIYNQLLESRKNPVQSYTTNNQKETVRITEDGKHVRIPKLELIRIKLHRQLPQGHTIKSATISRSASGKYNISILTAYTVSVKPIIPCPEKVLGLDQRFT